MTEDKRWLNETGGNSVADLSFLTRRLRRELYLISILILIMILWLTARVFFRGLREVSEWISIGLVTCALAVLGIVHAYGMRKMRTEDFDRIRYLTMHDELTDVYNLRYIKLRVGEEMLRADRYNHPFSILYLDLDKFKTINDTYGHKAGDEVLRSISQLLRDSCRATDLVGRVVGRVGGDEFLIILPETALEESCRMARRLVQSVLDAEVTVKGGHALRVGASIGVAEYPTAGKDQHILLEQADRAMYRAKQAGGSCCADFRGHVYPMGKEEAGS